MPALILITGHLCNNNCIFCSDKFFRKEGNPTLEELKKIMIENPHCDELVLQGETTIRKDIFELLTFVKTRNLKRVQLLSNGRMLSNYEFCKKIVSLNTITDFLINTPAHKQETHEKITQVPGSFKQTKKAIQNLKKLKQYVTAYCAIIKQNYIYLPEIASYYLKLDVDEVQMVFVHPLGNASTEFFNVTPKISLIEPHLIKSLDILSKEKIKIAMNGIPLCIMGKYSDKIIPFNKAISFYAKKVNDKESMKFIDESNITIDLKENIKTKFPQCKQCIKNNSCEGVWNRYAKEYGGKEFKPIK
jgi:MoaA/NifB/PqqE/SkfB family radical SAM enzyme